MYRICGSEKYQSDWKKLIGDSIMLWYLYIMNEKLILLMYKEEYMYKFVKLNLNWDNLDRLHQIYYVIFNKIEYFLISVYQ